MANSHIKRCSPSLVIRETQIKTIIRYHCTYTNLALIKKDITNFARMWRNGNPHALLLGMHCGAATSGKYGLTQNDKLGVSL